MSEFEYWEHERELVSGREALACPACSQGVFSQHEDGNFKLFRWERDYEPSRKPYNRDRYLFSPDSKAKEHMNMIDAALGTPEVIRH